jgi:hypothetical protein
VGAIVLFTPEPGVKLVEYYAIKLEMEHDVPKLKPLYLTSK